MKKIRYNSNINAVCFLILILILTISLSYANEKINIEATIKKYKISNENLALIIENESEVIYQLNSQKLMIPASLTKIITGATLLKHFNLNKKFETTLKLNSKEISGNILKGDLCLKGDGDPSFVFEKMWYLVNEFKRVGINEIQGNLLIDSSKFDEEIFDKGRDSKRVDRAFDAPVSATSFNWNSIAIYLTPSDKVKSPVNVILSPLNDFYVLENRATTSSQNEEKRISVTRDREKIVVTGQLPLNSNEVVVYKSITDPVQWLGKNLISILKKDGVNVKGEIKNQKCDNLERIVATSSSKNFIEMISDMLKFSNNFVAEMLVKNLAFEKGSNPAKMSDGIEILKKYLDEVGPKRNEYVLENVSGLTRENRFSPMQINKVLKNIKGNVQIYPEFLSSLPIAGVDGTLKNRFKSSNIEGKKSSIIRAKTGNLDGVIGLSGIVEKNNTKPLFFTFIFNGKFEEGLKAKKMFEEFLNYYE